MRCGTVFTLAGVACGLILLGSTAALPQGPVDIEALMKQIIPDRNVWKGKVTIERAGRQTLNVDKSRGGNISTQTASRTLHDETVIEACGVPGTLYTLAVERTLQDESNKKDYKRLRATVCDPPPDSPRGTRPEKKSPGNWTRITEAEVVKLYTGKGVPPMQKSGGVVLQLQPGGVFTLMANATHLVTRRADKVQQEHSACSEKTKRSEHHVETCPLGQKGDVRGGKENTRVTLPPMEMPTGIQDTGRVMDGVIQATAKVVNEIQPKRTGDYREKTTVSYLFERKDSCREVWHAFAGDIMMGEAFAEAGLQNLATNDTEFKKSAWCLAHKRRWGRLPLACEPDWKPEKRRGARENDMAVNPKDCGILHREEYEQRERRACHHPIIFESVLAHEKKHVQQCFSDNQRFVKRAPADLGRFEAEAYAVGARMLLGWLEDSCGGENFDLAGARARLEALQKRVDEMNRAAGR